MSQLVHIKQRIKAIETIKKITHAMRLISMSSHSRLRAQEKPITAYKTYVTHLFQSIPQRFISAHPLARTHEHGSHLVIIVGSQKGLCGSFNNNLATFFYKQLPSSSFHTLFIGKKARTVIQEHPHAPQEWFTVGTYDEYSPSTFVSIAHEVSQYICNHPTPYQTVTVYSNHPKSFFMQEPSITPIVPFDSHIVGSLEEDNSDIIWDMDPACITDIVIPFYVRSCLQHILYNSLLAEYSARFVSMDGATRNAHHLLESTQLVYNKLRQAKITKELTELIGSM